MSKKKEHFKDPKMLASRVEKEDFLKFEKLIKYRDHRKLQEVVNIFLRSYISGSVIVSGSQILSGPDLNE